MTLHGNHHQHDARSDLGYGRITPRFHMSRSRGNSYPYVDPDDMEEEIEDIEIDRETVDAVLKKTTAYTEMDPFAVNKTNPFYYGAGNLKLSDCFWHVDKVLVEVDVMASSMASVPGMYKGKNVMFGGSDGHAQYLTPGSFKRTGTLQGWSKDPPPVSDDIDEDENNIKTLSDLIRLMIDDKDTF